MKKKRHLKTLYERFSHHKTENLEDFMKELKTTLLNYYTEAERYKVVNSNNPLPTNIFEVLKKLNIMSSGTFYVQGFIDDGAYYSDAEVFRDIWEHIKVDKHLRNNDKKYLKVQVLKADYKDVVLVIYQNTRTLDRHFNMHIIRDKNGEFLLQGNIAHLC